MKKLLFILILGLTGGAFTSCTDLTTDLDLETNTRIVYISSSSSAYVWQVGLESHTIEIEIAFAGIVTDIPVKFKLVQTNIPADNAPAITKLMAGEAGVTYIDMTDQVFEIPAGQKSVKVPVKFIKDPNRVETTNGQLKHYGWATDFAVVLLNQEEVDARLLAQTIKITEYDITKVLAK